jgi:catechol 2,3-dioxygenase-like lactoylglutathione lyase family enzyme
MFDHAGLNVSDYTRSKDFYVQALAPLGYEVLMAFEGGAGFGRDRAPRFWIAQREPVGGVAVAAGGKDNGPPGIRPEYHETYHAAYVHDPGRWFSNIEVQHTRDAGARVDVRGSPGDLSARSRDEKARKREILRLHPPRRNRLSVNWGALLGRVAPSAKPYAATIADARWAVRQWGGAPARQTCSAVALLPRAFVP